MKVGRPFVKGDPRINRKGRPKTFDALRELAIEIAHEVAVSGGKEVIINGKKITVTEAILRKWALSSNPKLQMAFVEVAFGRVPNVTEVTGKDGGPIQTKNESKHDFGFSKMTPEQIRAFVAGACVALEKDDDDA